MASIVKRGRSYSVVYMTTVDGQRKQKWETYHSLDEAERRKKVLTLFCKITAEKSGKRIDTVRDLMDRYILLYGQLKWSFSTFQSNCGLIRNYILPLLGAIRLQELSPLVVAELYREFLGPPGSNVTDLVSSVKCSEMDILLDLMCSAVYRDERVKGSYSAPVVYFRNGTGGVMVTYEDLCGRWGLSRMAVRRVLLKLERAGFISLRGSPGCPELLIYLTSELATSFQISDILVDKDELPMKILVQFPVSGDDLPNIKDMMAERVLQLLDIQGIGCAKCQRCTYELYLLPRPPAAGEKGIHSRMDILCGCGSPLYSFELSLSLCEN